MGIKVREGYEAVWYYRLNRKTGKISETLVEKTIKPGLYGYCRVYPVMKDDGKSWSYTVSNESGKVYYDGIWFKKKNPYEAKQFLIESISKQNTEMILKVDRNDKLIDKIYEVNK